MKTIIITGPSGSGKSYLSNKLSKIFYNSIVIKTDSYYRDNILIQILSNFIYDIYDRPFSIKKDELNKTLRSIQNEDRFITFYNYNFILKKSTKSIKSINYNNDNQFLIIEGIFAHRLDLNYQDTINILCDGRKDICFQRRLKRDKRERGRNNIEVKNKFKQSWNLFYKNIKYYVNNYNVMEVNLLKKDSYNRLIINLKNIKNN
ncbi:uridine kinase family protein [Prochlorococcus marinus]|uniref:uridine kinase family protein n=1 Tax=Prochlorococcus marinus TaxID=1219 RepID=UPI0022B3C838|nr:AAA family ATPase [Prochlorococcus marinus]